MGKNPGSVMGDLYLATARGAPAVTGQGRPAQIPRIFTVLVVKRAS